MSRSIEIYNLACPASPIHYQHDPVQTTKTSVHGAINMLGLAKRLRAKILQASTSEVYGDPSVHPQPEEYWGNVNPIGPRSCYDEGKRCAETLFFDYRRQHKLRIKVARIFNTYGPRMHPNDGRVVSNFIVQALGRDITVFGDGLQTRSFCYVDDLIDGLVRLMDTADDVTGPINIGNPNEFTILELASLVIETDGIAIADRAPAAAAGRSAAAPAGHFEGQRRAEMGPADRTEGRPGADNRLFRGVAARRCRSSVHYSRTRRRGVTRQRRLAHVGHRKTSIDATADLRQSIFLSRPFGHEPNPFRSCLSSGGRRATTCMSSPHGKATTIPKAALAERGNRQ